MTDDTAPVAEPIEGGETQVPQPPVQPPPRPRRRPSPARPSAPHPAKPPRKPAAIKPAPAPALGKHGLDRVGGKWGVASILGSLAAAAGLTAALLSLKGSTPGGMAGRVKARTVGARRTDALTLRSA
ncbi:hypothetical protein P0F65_04625 [Sphingomonas sp. I4]